MHPFCRSTTIPIVKRTNIANKNVDKIDDISYNEDVEKRIDESLKLAREQEPRITKELQDIVEANGGKLVGLEYRLKTRDSLKRKVLSDLQFNSNIIEVVNSINDNVRYTSIIGSNNYVKHYYNVKKDLEKHGYKLIKVKNFWTSKNNPYNGLNVIVENNIGYKFELQFHTQESFDLKQGILHKLYEQYRILPLNSTEAKEIQMKMFEISEKLEPPKDIEVIK